MFAIVHVKNKWVVFSSSNPHRTHDVSAHCNPLLLKFSFVAILFNIVLHAKYCDDGATFILQNMLNISEFSPIIEVFNFNYTDLIVNLCSSFFHTQSPLLLLKFVFDLTLF